MGMALIGASISLLILSKLHDTQLENIPKKNEGN
jgi:hypothetical protein